MADFNPTGYDELYGTEGNDNYNINFSQSEIGIYDPNGEDTITLNDVFAKKGHNINFLFDVTKEIDSPCDNTLFILKDDKFQDYAKCVYLEQEKTIWGSMWIEDFINGSGYIENIEIAHGINGKISEFEDYYNKVSADVRTWLTNHPEFETAMEALATCRDRNAIKELINCYTKETCPIELIYNENLPSQEELFGVRPGEFLGGSANEVIYATTDSIVSANKGDDKLFRGEHNDAPATNYKLYGEAGNDILEAGIDATLNGGVGENVIIINGNSDCIVEHGKGKDYINFVNATSFEDLEFGQTGQDLVIQVTGKNERVTLKDYYKYKANYSVKGISFGDIGNIKDLASLNYLYADDILKSVKSESVGLFVGTENNDTINGSKDNDYIVGQYGNDKLQGGTGENIFVFDNNSGHDTITMGRGVDTLRFVDIDSTYPSFKFTNNRNDLVISYNDGNCSVTIKNYLANPDKASVKDIEFMRDGVVEETLSLLEIAHIDISGIDGKKNNIKGTSISDEIDGGNLDDVIKAGKGNDGIAGKEGNDKLYGEFGNNTFYFSKGHGNDTIYAGKGTDSIVFSTFDELGGSPEKEVYLEDLTISVNKNDLIIKYSENDSIALANYLRSGSSVDKIYCYNGETSVQELLANNPIVIDGVDGKKNNLIGTALVDELNGGDCDDTIKGGLSNDFITGGKGNDRLYGDGGDDTYAFNTDDEYDTIYSAKNSGEDTIKLNNNLIEDLTLTANRSDLVINYSENGNIALSNYLRNGTSVTKIEDYEGRTTTIEELIANNSILINGVDGKRNNLTGTYLKDEIHGGNADDIIKGGAGNDEIYGGAGNDKLYGDGDSNTFYFSDGDGQDTIYMGKGNDTIVINKSDSPDFNAPVYSRKGNNLVISYGTITEDANGREFENTITVANYFSSKNPSVKTVRYSDYENGEVNLSDVVVNGIYNTEYRITVHTGNDYDNLIYTKDNYDYAISGAGNDNIQINSRTEAYIIDSAGDDTYTVNSLRTGVTIEDSSGFDQLVINENSNNVNVLWEVYADGSACTTDPYSSMLIVNDADLNKIVQNRNIFSTSSGIEILDFIKGPSDNPTDYAIDIIRAKDKYVVVQDLQNAIASWLSDNGYSSTSELLSVENAKAEVNELMTYCQETAWHPYN